MSATAEAKPLSRRMLERQGMTPEEELDLLIQEQKADDTFFVSRPPKEISFESPAPQREGVVSDFIGVDEHGKLVCFLPREEGACFSARIAHATFDAYNNHKCRCRPCKTFMAAYRRNKRSAAA